jgi:alpha-mannosidase
VAAEVGPLYEGLEAQSIAHPGVASLLMIKGCFPLPTTSGWWRVPWLGPGSGLDWTLELLLRPDSPRIDLSLKLAWKGESSRIRLRIATTILSADALYEVPFGTVRRVPYGQLTTAKGVWPANRFVLVENGAHGLALVNTGAHGVEATAGTLWTTLLRAPAKEYAGMVPDDTSSQHGQHQYLFALVPFQGPWQESAVLRSAQELNSPLRLEESAWPATASLFELEGLSTVVLSCLKLADDRKGDLVVRLYETAGRSGDARMYVRGLQEVWKTDLREERGPRLTCRDSRFSYSFSPFEIATFLLRRE